MPVLQILHPFCYFTQGGLGGPLGFFTGLGFFGSFGFGGVFAFLGFGGGFGCCISKLGGPEGSLVFIAGAKAVMTRNAIARMIVFINNCFLKHDHQQR